MRSEPIRYPTFMDLQADIDDMTAQLTEWRHDFHRHPELGYQETRTAKLVAERLTSFGLEVHTELGVTGVVGTLRGQLGEGPSLGLRADMDALPMTEETGSPHASTHPGVFHGCGHDGHTTMLLGAAQALAKNPAFRGTVHFIFQPAEEGLAGALAMMKDGLFQRFPCDEVYGMHNWPQVPLGKVALRPGPVMAASDLIEIEVEGVGAHAAMPHRGIDPVYVASQIISGLQSLVSRTVDPQDAAVVSITKVEAGSATNVIPRLAKLAGTCRTFQPETRDAMEAGIERIATHTAAAHGATARVTYTRGYPPTVNHAAQVEIARRAASAVVDDSNLILDAAPSMGGEDFAFMLDEVPGCYIWLGAGGDYDVHHPRYDFNDRAIPLGVRYWTELVTSRLA
ncbi:MAG: amidohydrolase [Planctomycetota bacterium]|jgi:amidohydrolase